MIMANRLIKIVKLSQQAFFRYKWQIVILTVLGFTDGLLEGIGVNALIPLFSFVLQKSGRGSDLISQQIENFFSFLHLEFQVNYLLFFITSLFILKAFISVFSIYLKTKIISDYEERTRTNLFRKILQANWPHLIKHKLGYLENVLMVDVSMSSGLLNNISAAIMLVTSLSMYLLVAINISYNITVITLILGAIFFFAIKPLISKTKLLAQRKLEINKEIAHQVNENILGVKTVKAMMINEAVTEKAKVYFRQLKELFIKMSIVKGVSGSFVQPLALIFICLIFLFTYQSPDFNLAALAVIIYLIQKIFIYIQQLEKSLHNINEQVPHLQSTLNYEKAAEENQEVNRGYKPFTFNRQLEFRNLAFAYDQQKEVLTDINFMVKKGEMIGIVGPSGVGKTTLVDLILRLFPLKKGEIILDGVDITEIDLRDWRKNIGYVSQDMFLINETIANNIKFYDDSISDEEMIQAAKMANIYDFIQSRSEKFNTLIGERGILISAGQRQRIVIARILARKPQLLILDEATSALDNESEVQIQKVIKELKGKVTVLAIAHRLSTVMDSDRLVVLENGKVVEHGSPQELLKDKESYFYKVYNIRE